MTRAALWTPGDTPQEGAKAVGLYSAASGQTITVPDSDTISVVGDFDMRIHIALDDWLSSPTLAAKSGSTGDRSWQWYKQGGGRNFLNVYYDGTSAVSFYIDQQALWSSLISGQWIWLRVSFDADNGAGGSSVHFYYSDDGFSWVSGGVSVRVKGLPFDSTAAIQVGGTAVGWCVNAFELRNGIDGPIVAQWDGSVPHERQVDPQGNVWTVNGTANAWQEV